MWVPQLGQRTGAIKCYGKGRLDDAVGGETTARAGEWGPTELRVPAGLFESELGIQTTMYVMS